MIDDELLQELLVRATGLYNNGDYRGAIAAWREALAVDPSSQKAREGIQMATLLLADWDPTGAPPAAAEPAPPADGGAAKPTANPEADARRIDQGVRRVRGLILERKYSEAIEGARGLVPIDPDSEEVQRLVEEAQQAFESAPFIDEHLTLSQELLDQGRRDEAEAECRKVFALDPANPHAHALLATIQGKGAVSPAPAPAEPPGDLGGRTMRIDRSQLQAFQDAKDAAQRPDPKPPAPTPQPAAPEQATDEPDRGAGTGEAVFELQGDAEPPGIDRIEIADLPGDADAPAETQPESTSGAREPELDFLPEDALELNADAAATPGTEVPDIEIEGLALDAPLEISATEPETPGLATATGGESPGTGPKEADTPGEPEVIEATTVVPPSVRLVERSAEGQAALDKLMQRLDEEPEAIESIPLAVPASPASSRPAAAVAPADPAAPPAAAKARPDASWEQELESLNRKSGAHEIVGRSAASAAAPEASVDEDLDLTALMGDEIGPLHAPSPEPHEGPPAETPRPAARPAQAEGEAPFPPPRPARPRERSAARLASMTPPPGERRAGVTTSLFALGGVVILAIGVVVWWFFFQPRNVAGRSQPPAAASPPSASSGAAHAADPGPIPTPIGSTSKQAEPAAHQEGDGAAEPAPPPTVEETAQPVVPEAAGRSSGAAAPIPAPAPTRQRTAEEIRQETAQHLAAGKSYLAAERWQEARRELAAALALDPVNFECKELLEKAQAKVDQDTKVRQEYDEARRLFQDKDYQGALWKLYRLPKDSRFGDLDIPIRNAWYNWAVVALKGGDATTATQKLNEVFQVDPADAEAEKMMAVATQYASRPKDRGFHAFVDTLRFRSFDGK